MKFSVITALSLSALTLAAPIEQAIPEQRVAAVNAADASQFPWPRIFGGKAPKPPSTFAIAKAAFIGARLGAVSGTRFTGAKAFFGAKYGALKGVSKGLRRLRGGRRQGGFGPRPFGGGFGSPPFAPRPPFGGGLGKGFGGGGFGKGYHGGVRRDAQSDLQAPEEMTAPQSFEQPQPQPQWASYAPEAPESQEAQEGGEDVESQEEFQPQEQQPFDVRTIDAQISRALAEAEVPAEAETQAAPESEAAEAPAVEAPAVVPADTPAAA